MNDAGKMWTLYDSEKLRSVFYTDGQNVHIDRKAMDSILQTITLQKAVSILALAGI